MFATDPGAVDDFLAFCRQRGIELLVHSEDDGIYQFLIKKSAYVHKWACERSLHALVFASYTGRRVLS